MLNNFDINSIVQIFMLLVVSGQLYMLNKSFRADHERRKKQSTIEYINTIRTSYKELTNELIDKFGDNAINLSEIDAETKNNIKQLLSILEHMSVGINTDVYDFYILKRMSGSFLVSRYHQLYPYINNSQKKNQTFYIEFERLCNRMKSNKKSKFMSDKGNIKFS